MRKVVTALTVMIAMLCASTQAFAIDASISVTNETVTALNIPVNGSLIVAAYCRGTLVDAKRYSGSDTIAANYRQDMAESLKRADTLKVFVWDVQTLKPLCNSFSSLISDLPKENNNQIIITVGSHNFTATLEDNQTAMEFRKLLPLTIYLSELNGNEKYYYLPQNLPTHTENTRLIRAGDLMLYGSSCLVLFYETFRTSYSYTRLGHIDDVSGLKAALGTGGVTVTIK